MAETINCQCGYRGPPVSVDGVSVCPICRTPAPRPAEARPGAAPPSQQPRTDLGPGSQPKRYRIPCPRGHVLKAAEHMLGQQVVCPECNEMFVLREADSLERRAIDDLARRAEEERMAGVWLARSLWAAAAIMVALVILVAISLVVRAAETSPVDPSSARIPAARKD